MEAIFAIHLLMMGNPYYVVGLAYLLGMTIQLFFTNRCLRNRREILIEEYEHTPRSLSALRVVSVLFWPVSWWYGVRSLYERLKVYRRRGGIEEVRDEYEDE